MESSQKAVEGWTGAEVRQWLSELGLPVEVQLAFSKNAVAGEDLAALTDDDLTGQLGCTPLQARKIRQHLSKLGVAPPATPSIPASSTASIVSAEASAAPPGTAAEPDLRACFEPADLQRYRQLQQQLGELQGLQPSAKVSQATSHMDSVQRALANAEAALQPIQAALAQEQKHVAKYKGETFAITSLFTTRHHKDVKLAEAQGKVDSLSRQLGECQAALAARQAELREAQAQLSAWQDKASELAAIRAQLEAHIERVFGTPTWRASPRQAELADALNALEAQAGEAAKGASTYGRGNQLLQESKRLLQQALEGLQQTQMFTMMDMGMGMGYGGGFGRVPGHLFDDIIEMQIIQRSNDEIAMAAARTAEAATLLPGLPQVDGRVLQAAKMGIFQNILFGGLGSDMIELAMVHRSKRDVEALQQQVAAAASWALSNAAVYQHKSAEAQAAVAAKRAELDGFRTAALERALAA